MNQLKVVSTNGKLVTDSRDVAEMIGKEHKILLRDIRKYTEYMGTEMNPSTFFIESYYSDAYERNKVHYLLTKKGCDMVANKMTGKKGVLFTAEYVTRFEEMKEELTQPYKLPNNYKEALLQLVESEEKKEHLLLENSQLKPKATYYDLIMQNKSLISISKIAKDYGLSGQDLNKILHELGVQYKQGDTWLLYQNFAPKGYTHSKTHDYDGGQKNKLHTYWTQKGRAFIYEILKEKKGIIPVVEKENFQMVLV